ncbi:MAG: hypothetical protein U1G08_19740 [Verrucomicrobiota bacterium]
MLRVEWVVWAGVGVLLGLMLAGMARTGIREGVIPRIWGMAALALMLEMGRHQPWQYVVAVSILSGGAGALSSVWAHGTGLPFWGWTAVWVAAILGARGTARWVLRRWCGTPHFGLGVLALASVIAAAVMEIALGDRRWIPGVPDFVSALLAAGVVQILVTPWFLEKRTLLPVIRSAPAALLGLAVAGAVAIRILLVG